MSFDWRRLLPSVAVFAGFNTNLVSPTHQKQSLTGRIGLLFQNDFSKSFNVITNVFHDYIGSNQSEISLQSRTFSTTITSSTLVSSGTDCS